MTHYRRRRLDPDEFLTHDAAVRFVRHYARSHRLSRASELAGRASLHAWSTGLVSFSARVPAWESQPAPKPYDSLLGEYRQYCLTRRGIKEYSFELESRFVGRFFAWLRRRRRPVSSVTAALVRRFMVEAAPGLSYKTVLLIGTSLRAFLRFLHVTGRLGVDLSQCVASPAKRRGPELPQSWPVRHIRRILAVINRKVTLGKRDYAVLLLMASYGMGANEALGLKLDDIDWRRGSFRFHRSKTGTAAEVPLLGPVARALACYLRDDRRRGSSQRFVFLRLHAPQDRLGRAGLRNRLQHYCRVARLPPAPQGTHSFRHSFATRQVEGAAPPKVVSEIMGHRDPGSLSHYAQIAIKRLRRVGLPVPR